MHTYNSPPWSYLEVFSEGYLKLGPGLLIEKLHDGIVIFHRECGVHRIRCVTVDEETLALYIRITWKTLAEGDVVHTSQLVRVGQPLRPAFSRVLILQTTLQVYGREWPAIKQIGILL